MSARYSSRKRAVHRASRGVAETVRRGIFFTALSVPGSQDSILGDSQRGRVPSSEGTQLHWATHQTGRDAMSPDAPAPPSGATNSVENNPSVG